MPTSRLGFVPHDSSPVSGVGRLLAHWYDRLRDIVLRDPEPASRAYRFMSRLIEKEFVRKDSGVCLALSAPDSDKTSTDAVLMLAYCLRSELDSRVLVIDARLKDRLAGVTGRLGLAQDGGFAEILRDGYGGRENLICATALPNVDVLPSGDPQRGGTIPINRLTLKQLVDTARTGYDHVLLQISSPLRDTRTLMIAAEADAVFLIAEENKTFMKTLDECRAVLISNGIQDVRVVVTCGRA